MRLNHWIAYDHESRSDADGNRTSARDLASGVFGKPYECDGLSRLRYMQPRELDTITPSSAARTTSPRSRSAILTSHIRHRTSHIPSAA